ncbi:MAG: alpha/beta fold hydrolase, partial [Gammaproteobacteria bacterium]
MVSKNFRSLPAVNVTFLAICNVTYLPLRHAPGSPKSVTIENQKITRGAQRMEKVSTLSGNFNNLFPRFAKKRADLLNRFLPGWTNDRIDSKLFIPKTRDTKPLRLPRGFKQTDIKTKDGMVKAYQTGKGPMVVFVHGWGGSAQQFFPLMRGLAECGFSSMSFDHLGHGQSEM